MKSRLSSAATHAAVALLSVGFAAGRIVAAESAKDVLIVANDTLKFNLTQIEAHPGESIHVQLRNDSVVPKESMGHNWVLLDNDSEALPYATEAIADRADGFMPKALAKHVLAFIPLLGPKETGDVTFTAPSTPGSYPFICSSMGHSMSGMRGELIVR